jgi:hypothetical protein
MVVIEDGLGVLQPSPIATGPYKDYSVEESSLLVSRWWGTHACALSFFSSFLFLLPSLGSRMIGPTLTLYLQFAPAGAGVG